MAGKFKKCKACGKLVAPSAKDCPCCGLKLKMGLGKKTLIGVVALVVLRMISSVSKSGSTSTAKIRSLAPSPLSATQAINVTSSDSKLLDKEKREVVVLTGETVGLDKAGGKSFSYLTVNPGKTVIGYLLYDVSKGLSRFTMEASQCVTGIPTRLIRQS